HQDRRCPADLVRYRSQAAYLSGRSFFLGRRDRHCPEHPLSGFPCPHASSRFRANDAHPAASPEQAGRDSVWPFRVRVSPCRIAYRLLHAVCLLGCFPAAVRQPSRVDRRRHYRDMPPVHLLFLRTQSVRPRRPDHGPHALVRISRLARRETLAKAAAVGNTCPLVVTTRHIPSLCCWTRHGVGPKVSNLAALATLYHRGGNSMGRYVCCALLPLLPRRLA